MHLKFAVIGSSTERELWKYGFSCDYMPDAFSSADLAKGLVRLLRADDRVGLFRAKEASDVLSTELKKNNISFQEISLYETVIEERKKEELLRQLSKMDYVTFGSSSAVKAFVTMTKDYDGIMPKLVSIGPITTASMQEYGLNVTKTAKIYTAKGMCDAIVEEQEKC